MESPTPVLLSHFPSPSSRASSTAAWSATAAAYCLCRGPDDGRLMVQCGGCEEWFHASCCGLLIPTTIAASASSASPTPPLPPAVEGAAAAATTISTTLVLSIPDDWRCPVCAPAAYTLSPAAKGSSNRRVRIAAGRKRALLREEEDGRVDSEAEAEAVESEVKALLREQGGEEEDEEVAACLRREVERRRTLGA